jgi:hypothetical protein
MTSTQKLNSADSKQAVEEFDTEVLYQKLGDRWFAFSLMMTCSCLRFLKKRSSRLNKNALQILAE